MDVLEDIYTWDVEVNTTAIPEPDYPQYGFERMKPTFAKMREAFPGLQAVIDDLVEEKDRVAARVRYHGNLPGQANNPTGRQLLWTGVDIFRMYRGKIAGALRGPGQPGVAGGGGRRAAEGGGLPRWGGPTGSASSQPPPPRVRAAPRRRLPATQKRKTVPRQFSSGPLANA